MTSKTTAPNNSLGSLAVQRKKQAISLLKELSEDDLKDRIILPLFTKRGWSCTSVDRRNEGQHRCDVLMESDAHDDVVIQGAQLKKKNIRNKHDVRGEIERAAAVALKLEYLLSNGLTSSLSKFYWITSGDIDPIGQIGINECFGKGSPYFGRVDVWGVERLVAEIQRSAPDLLPPLELLQIERSIDLYRRNGQGVFAAHRCYEAFCWHLRQPGVQLDAAVQCIQDALLCMTEEKRTPLFYWRSLWGYYEGLLILLEEARAQRLPWHPDRFLDETLYSDQAVMALQRRGSSSSAWLVRDIQNIHRQARILLDRFITVPAPLIPVQICRCLLRLGYPASEPAIALCLKNAEEQLEKEGWTSIDGKCSLCTATAVSCFSLAGGDQWPKVDLAVDWLGTLKPFRYCYLEGRTYGLVGETYSHHALHYAATVLTAYLDGGMELRSINDVMEVFFQSNDVDAYGFYLDWMIHRNEDRFEICRYIFSAFLRFLLVGGTLQKEEEARLKKALQYFVAAAYDEAANIQDPSRFYAARTNLGSLALGMALDVDETVVLAKRVAGVLHRRGIRAGVDRGLQLWDGSAERTLAFIEGLLDYWETILFLEKHGKDVSRLLPEEALNSAGPADR